MSDSAVGCWLLSFAARPEAAPWWRRFFTFASSTAFSSFSFSRSRVRLIDAANDDQAAAAAAQAQGRRCWHWQQQHCHRGACQAPEEGRRCCFERSSSAHQARNHRNHHSELERSLSSRRRQCPDTTRDPQDPQGGATRGRGDAVSCRWPGRRREQAQESRQRRQAAAPSWRRRCRWRAAAQDRHRVRLGRGDLGPHATLDTAQVRA